MDMDLDTMIMWGFGFIALTYVWQSIASADALMTNLKRPKYRLVANEVGSYNLEKIVLPSGEYELVTENISEEKAEGLIAELDREPIYLKAKDQQ